MTMKLQFQTFPATRIIELKSEIGSTCRYKITRTAALLDVKEKRAIAVDKGTTPWEMATDKAFPYGSHPSKL